MRTHIVMSHIGAKNNSVLQFGMASRRPSTFFGNVSIANFFVVSITQRMVYE